MGKIKGTYGNQIEWKDDRNAVLIDQFDSQYNLQIIDENTLSLMEPNLCGMSKRGEKRR